jgi:hypothetical protein
MCHHHRHRDVTTRSAAADPGLRAADADRDATADLLRRASGEGRLGVDELEQRLELAYAARTAGDLRALTADLPTPRRSHAAARRAALKVHARIYVLVNLMLVAIWALDGFCAFWPAGSIFGWGIGLTAHALAVAPWRTTRRVVALR